MRITYSECVFESLFIQHGMRMGRIVLSGCTIFSDIIS